MERWAPGMQIDNLTYFYAIASGEVHNGKLSTNNRLKHVTDAVPTTRVDYDVDEQAVDNYSYDGIGNLTADPSEGISSIEWDVYGKVTKMTKSGAVLSYQYDAMGNRMRKAPATGAETWYVRDAQGNVL